MQMAQNPVSLSLNSYALDRKQLQRIQGCAGLSALSARVQQKMLSSSWSVLSSTTFGGSNWKFHFKTPPEVRTSRPRLELLPEGWASPTSGSLDRALPEV